MANDAEANVADAPSSSCYVCGHPVTPYYADRLICTVCFARKFGRMGASPEVTQSRRVETRTTTGDPQRRLP